MGRDQDCTDGVMSRSPRTPMARPTTEGYSAYMRTFFPVFALLLPGCELEPCDAAIATVRACDLAVEDSVYPDLADTCPS